MQMTVLLRWLKRLGFFFLALIVLYAIGRPTQIWLDGFYSGERAPYLQMMSPNAVTLRWQSKEPGIGVVRYGEQVDKLNKSVKEKLSAEEHEVRLTQLKPATKYYYSVGNENEESFKGANFWFKTAPEISGTSQKNAAVRFWVTGDQGYANPIQDQVRDAMLNWVKQNPRSAFNDAPNNTLLDFWVTTGDNAYPSGSNQQFQAGFFQPYKAILRNTPVWPVYGNHDARRWVFFDLFTFPANAETGGVASGTEHYYSFDYANVHIVILDTEKSDLDVDGAMLSWLKKDLSATKQQWLIAFTHHPPYTKGSHDSDSKWDSRARMIKVRENVLPILEKAGVDVVLSGHSHMYERSELMNCHYGDSSSFNPSMVRMKDGDHQYQKKEKNISANSGTIYAVIGSSSKVDDGPLNHPAMPHSFKEAGSMIFDVYKNRLKASFINKQGKVKDQFEIIKGVTTGSDTRLCR